MGHLSHSPTRRQGTEAGIARRAAVYRDLLRSPGSADAMAQRRFANCLRLNYGHPWDARAEAATATSGRLVAATTAQA